MYVGGYRENQRSGSDHVGSARARCVARESEARARPKMAGVVGRATAGD